MKIMSFNTQHCLNFLEQRIDYDIMAKAIKDAQADIVGLNEMFDGGEGAKFGEQTRFLSELSGLEKFIFSRLYAGNFSKKLYRLYEYKKD